MEVPKKGVSSLKQKIVWLLLGNRLLISDDHMLRCPRCKAKMRKIEKEKIIIDVCKHCQGMWLDDGEIEKLAKLEKKIIKVKPIGKKKKQ